MSRQLRTKTPPGKLEPFEQDVTRAREIAFDLVLDGIAVPPEEVLELIFIVLKYEDRPSERRTLIEEIAEELYPQTSEGSKAIENLIARQRNVAGYETQAPTTTL